MASLNWVCVFSPRGPGLVSPLLCLSALSVFSGSSCPVLARGVAHLQGHTCLSGKQKGQPRRQEECVSFQSFPRKPGDQQVPFGGQDSVSWPRSALSEAESTGPPSHPPKSGFCWEENGRLLTLSSPGEGTYTFSERVFTLKNWF